MPAKIIGSAIVLIKIEIGIKINPIFDNEKIVMLRIKIIIVYTTNLLFKIFSRKKVPF